MLSNYHNSLPRRRKTYATGPLFLGDCDYTYKGKGGPFQKKINKMQKFNPTKDELSRKVWKEPVIGLTYKWGISGRAVHRLILRLDLNPLSSTC